MHIQAASHYRSHQSFVEHLRVFDGDQHEEEASNRTDYRYGYTELDNVSDYAQDETIHDTHEEAEERIDSDGDLEFEGYFEELGNTTNENYYPFPSKIFALLFFLVYSPNPMVQVAETSHLS